ncbi:hypothetical protein SISNIDRAFT_487308 [Sistotremastrum niveocremeum HHB9708]|uniref:Uncharacterized protein n=1 Tax=Sistotremastrum niveocremeum HHB9708 TaxID=1314777 RepID=A0A164SN08_9AGAM|nr:hypothetical protein SISNIDRAFT_487308 [Sistotremastrum niveocremeum HHB9708]
MNRPSPTPSPSASTSSATPPRYPPPRAPLPPQKLAKIANAFGFSSPIPPSPSSSSLGTPNGIGHGHLSSSLFSRSPSSLSTSHHLHGYGYGSSSPSKFLLHVIPPSHLPHDDEELDSLDDLGGMGGGRPLTPTSSNANGGPSGYHTQFQRGTLVPLHSSLQGQLGAIAREYALPSTSGMILYLVQSPSDASSPSPADENAVDGRTMGPRISEHIWKALWHRVVSLEREESARSIGLSQGPGSGPGMGLREGVMYTTPSATRTSTPRSPNPSHLPLSASPRRDRTHTPGYPYPSPSPSTTHTSNSASASSPHLPHPSSHSTPDDASEVDSISTPSLPPSYTSSLNLSTSSLLPIIAKMEFDIDRRKAPWYDIWARKRREAVSRAATRASESSNTTLNGGRETPSTLRLLTPQPESRWGARRTPSPGSRSAKGGIRRGEMIPVEIGSREEAIAHLRGVVIPTRASSRVEERGYSTEPEPEPEMEQEELDEGDLEEEALEDPERLDLEDPVHVRQVSLSSRQRHSHHSQHQRVEDEDDASDYGSDDDGGHSLEEDLPLDTHGGYQELANDSESSLPVAPHSEPFRAEDEDEREQEDEVEEEPVPHYEHLPSHSRLPSPEILEDPPIHADDPHPHEHEQHQPAHLEHEPEEESGEDEEGDEAEEEEDPTVTRAFEKAMARFSAGLGPGPGAGGLDEQMLMDIQQDRHDHDDDDLSVDDKEAEADDVNERRTSKLEKRRSLIMDAVQLGPMPHRDNEDDVEEGGGLEVEVEDVKKLWDENGRPRLSLTIPGSVPSPQNHVNPESEKDEEGDRHHGREVTESPAMIDGFENVDFAAHPLPPLPPSTTTTLSTTSSGGSPQKRHIPPPLSLSISSYHPQGQGPGHGHPNVPHTAVPPYTAAFSDEMDLLNSEIAKLEHEQELVLGLKDGDIDSNDANVNANVNRGRRDTDDRLSPAESTKTGLAYLDEEARTPAVSDSGHGPSPVPLIPALGKGHERKITGLDSGDFVKGMMDGESEDEEAQGHEDEHEIADETWGNSARDESSYAHTTLTHSTSHSQSTTFLPQFTSTLQSHSRLPSMSSTHSRMSSFSQLSDDDPRSSQYAMKQRLDEIERVRQPPSSPIDNQHPKPSVHPAPSPTRARVRVRRVRHSNVPAPLVIQALLQYSPRELIPSEDGGQDANADAGGSRPDGGLMVRDVGRGEMPMGAGGLTPPPRTSSIRAAASAEHPSNQLGPPIAIPPVPTLPSLTSLPTASSSSSLAPSSSLSAGPRHPALTPGNLNLSEMAPPSFRQPNLIGTPSPRRSEESSEEPPRSAGWPAVPFAVAQSEPPPFSRDLSTNYPKKKPAEGGAKRISPPKLALNGVTSGAPPGFRPVSNEISEETKARIRENAVEHEFDYDLVGRDEASIGAGERNSTATDEVKEPSSPGYPISPDPFGRRPSFLESDPAGPLVPETATTATSTSSGSVGGGFWSASSPAKNSSRFSADSEAEETYAATVAANRQRSNSIISVKSFRKLWRKSNPSNNGARNSGGPPLLPPMSVLHANAANGNLPPPPVPKDEHAEPVPPLPTVVSRPPVSKQSSISTTSSSHTRQSQSSKHSRTDSNLDPFHFDQESRYPAKRTTSPVPPHNITSSPSKPQSPPLAPASMPASTSMTSVSSSGAAPAKKSILKAWKYPTNGSQSVPSPSPNSDPLPSTASFSSINGSTDPQVPPKRRKPSVLELAQNAKSRMSRGSLISSASRSGTPDLARPERDDPPQPSPSLPTSPPPSQQQLNQPYPPRLQPVSTRTPTPTPGPSSLSPPAMMSEFVLPSPAELALRDRRGAAGRKKVPTLPPSSSTDLSRAGSPNLGHGMPTFSSSHGTRI